MRMPRSRSLVTALPAPGFRASVRSATQTLSTPSSGAIQARRRPSGDIRGLIRSGLPKSTERGTKGTSIPAEASWSLRFVRPISPGISQEDAVPESAYVLIQTEVGKAAQVAAEIAKIQGIVGADDVTGPYDVIARAEANTLDELGKMVVSKVQLIDGITRTLTCPVVHL